MGEVGGVRFTKEPSPGNCSWRGATGVIKFSTQHKQTFIPEERTPLTLAFAVLPHHLGSQNSFLKECFD